MICGGYDDIHFLKLGPWTSGQGPQNFGNVGFERCKMMQAGQPALTNDCCEMTYTQYPTMISARFRASSAEVRGVFLNLSEVI